MFSCVIARSSSAGVTGSHRLAQFDPGFLLPQGSHPAPWDLKPGIPAETQQGSCGCGWPP